METASLIVSGSCSHDKKLVVEQLGSLDEVDYGALEGAALGPVGIKLCCSKFSGLAGGEPLEHVKQRSDWALAELARRATAGIKDRVEGKDVSEKSSGVAVAVSHGDFLEVLLARALGRSTLALELANCAISVLDVGISADGKPQTPVCLALGYTEHLL